MAGLGAYALMSSLLNLLSNLLPEVKNTFFAPSSSSSAQAPDARAVEDDLRRLERMLMRIKATLYDAEERNIQDQSIRLWLQEIRDLGREAEYILEEYMYEVYRAQVEARNSSKLSFIEEDINMSDVYSVLIPDGMVDRIRGITSRFEEIAKHREALHLPEEVDAPLRKKIRYTPTFTSSSVVEQNIFGREEEKENVINALLLGGDGISVLPIVGKGGIGKTTVAQLVYNDKKMQGCFDLVGWICVSNDFNIIRIGQNMMESFTEEACKLENPSVLVQKIKNIVKGKKIFLVLDDVWNEDPSLWESFCDPLMLATKVTILVTTRNISVARIMQTMNPLNLGYLSDDKCWLLFTHYAFQRIDPSNRASFVEIGKKLVEKCNGLPLAVKLIASLLIHEEELQSWIEVLQNDLWESDAGDKALAPLQLSYERLPTYLKQCLLLCSMFPKGHMYSMKLMSRLWIANGYIVAKGRKQIEEVAADYTKMLYERSFFDEYNIKMDIGYLLPVDTTFRLHDLVHELARLNLKKTWTSVKLIREPVIFKEECHLYLKLEGKLSGLPQRLCSIQTVVLRITWINPFLKLEEREKNNNILNNLLNAEHLRVLDLEYPTDDVPHFSLGKLKHLRYLSLRHGLFVVRISPESIFSCYNLRILILDIINIHMKLEGIGNLINLEFLQLFMYPRDLPESLGLLKKLRVLELHEHKNYHAGYYGNYDWNFLLPESIGNLVELQRIVIISLPIKKLPKSFCKLTNMKELILQNCFLEELPEDFRKLIPNCMMNICHLKKQPDNFFGAVGWLMEFNDLKGALLIQDIQNITSIADVKNANLINKCNLKTLLLSWNNTWDCSLGNLNEQTLRRDCLANKDILGIIIGHSEKCNSLNELDIDILDKFQPHPNLKHLYICAYPASEFPRWMGDPLSCASLVKLSIKSCSHIRSLPLGKVISLKHLNISVCDKLLHLKRGSLPTQLKHLTIYWCEILVEVELVESLVELEISTCRMLQSLTKKMPDTAQESSNFVSNYRHFEPSELKSLPSLKKMTIAECEKLVINVNQVVLAENCEVNIRNCSNLSDWCFQHNFKYDSDEPKKEHSIRGSLTCFGYPRRDMFQELTDLYGRPRRLMRGSEVLSLDGPPRRLPGGPINCTLSRQLRRTC